MPEVLTFWDMKGKKKFATSAYRYKFVKGKKFAVAKAPSGATAWRIVSRK